jgi:spermidine/putrescine transport system permease protein
MRQRAAVLRLVRRHPAIGTGLLLAPGGLWLIAFFLIPFALVIAASLLTRGDFGGVAPGFTLEHYRRFFEPLYLGVLLRTLLWALVAMLGCLLLGYPVAWVIARSRKYRNLLLFLVVLPFWSSFLVRTFAMIFLLRDSGLVNTVLLASGIVSEPVGLLYTPFAVLLGLVYGFLPFMILPIYASLERLDPALLEAAQILGARPATQLRTVMLPLSLPGVIAGCLLVFVSSFGSFLTSDLLGGAKQAMIGNLIQNQFTTARNWPFGSAASLIVMAVVMVTVLLSLRWRVTRTARRQDARTEGGPSHDRRPLPPGRPAVGPPDS